MATKRLGRMTWHTGHCIELETKVPFYIFFSYVVDFDPTVTFMLQKSIGSRCGEKFHPFLWAMINLV